ncbi:hypothetical protein HDIA_2628 [Hartmannibacter diazotrophicus]|uniref:VPEID-CTERM protein sorting domain protein n=1 Tax=Hartmannibacter diazotrophicus TaxID=1482074 RepID=A0A2C9D7M3_9HYPH|nr:hypothetical protein [Hartmannibacter diazotrophicus]SON56169.1 hypothetical protein HDIA_2628 [Hartmannibacter diazotrophicus]
MRKILMAAAAAAILGLTTAPSYAIEVNIDKLVNGVFNCFFDDPRGPACFFYSPIGETGPNGAPLPVAALGLPIAGGLMAYALRKNRR